MRNRRLFRLLAILFAFTLVAAACGDDDDSSSGSSSDSSSASASAGDPLNIGTLLPETGALAFLSAPLLEGVNMAIADINAAGGVNGADVTLTPGDSGTDPEIANTTVDRLLTEDVDAIVGAAASGITGSVIDKITSAGITQCSPSNTAAGLGTSGDDGYYFRTAPSDDLQAPALANVVLSDGYTNVAVVSRADDYGVGFNAEFEPAIASGGGTIVYNTPYAPEATSFDDVVQDVVASGPDAVVLVAFEEGIQILQTMVEQGAGPDAIQIYITDGMATGELGVLIDESNPGIASGMKGTQPAAAPSSGAAFFPEAFAAFAPGVSTIFSAQSYDCAILIALAAEAAGSNDSADIAAAMVDVSRDGEKCSTFADCKDLLAGGTNIDYDGASGAIDFLDVGEPGTGIYEVYEYDAGGVQEVLRPLLRQGVRLVRAAHRRGRGRRPRRLPAHHRRRRRENHRIALRARGRVAHAQVGRAVRDQDLIRAVDRARKGGGAGAEAARERGREDVVVVDSRRVAARPKAAATRRRDERTVITKNA